MAKRLCGMCDELVKGKECPKCGADTERCDVAELYRAGWRPKAETAAKARA